MHIDGDAFFASCEQAMHPKLRGKPIVTGRERGIISSASYEAKKYGVKRGVTPWDAKKMCPGLIFVQSDYSLYEAFSQRMFAVMRNYTPVVEEYSVDEAFADITGFRRAYHCSYEEIGRRMKKDIEQKLGITVSVGVSVSKVLAKIASKLRKPSGFVAIPAKEIELFLADLPIGVVWGIGAKTAAYAQARGIHTALDFARKREEFLKEFFYKPQLELWMELRGHSIYPVIDAVKISQVSIGKTHTFTPPSGDRAFVWAQLVRNLERACAKARGYRQAANRLHVFLKTQKFEIYSTEVRLPCASSFPTEIIDSLKKTFMELFSSGVLYRATGVTLTHLQFEESRQLSLFESPVLSEKPKKIFEVIDTLSEKMGKPVIYLGGSMLARVPETSPGAV